MRKILVLVTLIALLFPSGNVAAEGSCPNGNGWNSSQFPSDTSTVGITFSIKSNGYPIMQVCINGQIFESDSTIGSFSVSGLGTNTVWIVSNAQIYVIGEYILNPTATPTLTPTTASTSTPTATLALTATPIVVTETPIATVAASTPETSSPELRLIAIITIGIVIAALAIFAITKLTKKK